MKLDLNQADISTVVSKAILDSLNQEKRDTLIEAAIKHLLTPEKTPYSSNPITPLEEAFRQGARAAAQKLITEMVDSDAEFQAKIKSLIADATEKVIVTQREETISKMAESMIKGLTPHDRY